MTQKKLLHILARHTQFLTRIARMLAAAGRNDPMPKDAEFHEEEVRDLDSATSDLVVELTGSIPGSREWLPPGRNPYEKSYWRQDDGLNWLRRYQEGLHRSKNYLSLFLSETPTEVHMGDKISVGQAQVVMGSQARARDISVSGTVASSSGVDPAALAEELSMLRKHLRGESDPDNPAQDAEVGAVALAEQAAKDGDVPAALNYLRSVSSWVLDVATKIGVGVASAAIKQEIGIGK